MTMIVETGIGVADANSYSSVADMETYLSDRGRTELDSLSTAEKEKLLIQSTDYIELRWSSRFKGDKVDSDQDLSFPRTAFTGIPRDLKRACFEYAVQANSGPLAPALDQDDSGREIRSKSEDVAGAIKESVTYATTSPRLFRRYPVPDKYIKSLLRANGTRVIK